MALGRRDKYINVDNQRQQTASDDVIHGKSMATEVAFT